MNVLGVEPIPTGQRFAAFFHDGSCAGLFKKVGENEVLNVSAEPRTEEWLQDAGYVLWMPLPDNFKLWFERK